jgi:hypothetical protein
MCSAEAPVEQGWGRCWVWIGRRARRYDVWTDRSV